MKNNKGFTLIELLGIITIIAVIMVIAVPQIIKIFSNSTDNTWNNSVNGIENALSKNIQVVNPITGKYKYTVEEFCSNPSKLDEIVDYKNIDITCSNNTFTLKGKGQLDGKTAKISCENKKCSIEKPALAAGLYDSDDNLLASWDELINTYKMNPGWYYQYYDEENEIYDEFNDIQYFTQELIDNYYMEIGITKPGWYIRTGDNDYELIKNFDNIKSYAPAIVFQKYSNLKSGTKLVISGDIRVIKYMAFAGCINLKNIIILNGIQKIGESGFANCLNLERLKFPNTLNFIGYASFSGCKKLDSLIIPGSVYSIGEAAFGDCTGLSNLVLSEGLLDIQERAFENNFNLKKVVLPKSLNHMTTAFTKVDNVNGWGVVDISSIDIIFADPYNWGIYTHTPPYYDPIADLNTKENIAKILEKEIVKTIDSNVDSEAIWSLNSELDELIYQ